MPSWAKSAEALMRIADERYQFIMACKHLSEEELAWVNRHLDMAFEGRIDYLRR